MMQVMYLGARIYIERSTHVPSHVLLDYNIIDTVSPLLSTSVLMIRGAFFAAIIPRLHGRLDIFKDPKFGLLSPLHQFNLLGEVAHLHSLLVCILECIRMVLYSQ